MKYTKSEKWRLNIAEDISVNIIQKLDKFSVLFQQIQKISTNISVMGGYIGFANFYFYYSKLTKKQKYFDIANDIISKVFSEIEKNNSILTFAGGLTGVGWMIEHFQQQNFIEANTDKVLEDLDDLAYQMMSNKIQNGHYDYLHGAIGYGLYFLNRKKSTKIDSYISDLIVGLDDCSVKERNGIIKWQSIVDIETGAKGFNLSLSHGLASIINFLSLAFTAEILPGKTKILLDGTVRYLLSVKNKSSKYISVFPSIINSKKQSGNSRLAWCYGDLGIGISLWLASQRLDRKDWESEALEILLHSAKRRDLKENSVLDAGLCHGTAGIAHIYSRIYNYTGNEKFKEASIFWYQKTLEMAKFPDGYAGYKAWRSEKYGGYQPSSGLLEGVTGIGLSFISAISNIEPKWDRCLLLS